MPRMSDAPAHPSGAWVHDLDPFLWRIHGEIGVRWYGLAYLAGIVLGAMLIARWAKRGQAPLRPTEVQDFALVGGLAMVIGGRLGFCLFYDPALLTTFGNGFPWWGALRLTDGGMSSHGGIIGLFAGCLIWSRRHRRDLLVLCDLVCAVAPIGVIFGRLANFINGELWGRVCDAGKVPWAVVFPTELGHQILPPAERAARIAALAPRHPSQLYALILEGLIPLLVVLPLHVRHRRPSLTMGVLLIVYSFGRFIDEYWREPDAGQPGGPGGVPLLLGLFTKGQALTLPVALAGIILVLIALKRPPRPERYLPPDLTARSVGKPIGGA
jgi:phosphatidylglycerol:prolipoprotein diacylglycerol transferase